MTTIILVAAFLSIIDIQWIKDRPGAYRLYYVVAERWIDMECQKKIDFSKPDSPELAKKCYREEERFIVPATKNGQPITKKMTDAEAKRFNKKVSQ